MTLPKVNCTERIVIILDTSAGMGENVFDCLKKALEMFLVTKSTINSKHQFSLVMLQDSNTLWLQEFTSDINLIKDLIDEAQLEETRDSESQTFDMDQIVDSLIENCELPQVIDNSIPPECTWRTILIYGRSHETLSFSSKKELFMKLNSSPYFFFDVLFLHKSSTEDNRCQDIYNWFLELDKRGSSYILETSQNFSAGIYEQVAKLLAHPLQRCAQGQRTYELKPNNTTVK